MFECVNEYKNKVYLAETNNFKKLLILKFRNQDTNID